MQLRRREGRENERNKRGPETRRNRTYLKKMWNKYNINVIDE